MRYNPAVNTATDRNTRIVFGGKGGRCVGRTTLPSCADYLETVGSWSPQGLCTPYSDNVTFCLPAICNCILCGRRLRFPEVEICPVCFLEGIGVSRDLDGLEASRTRQFATLPVFFTHSRVIRH